jgi:hypothetical protein
VLNFDPSPLRIELRRGIVYYNSTVYKHVIFTPIKNLNFIPGFTRPFILFLKSFYPPFPQQVLVFRIVENALGYLDVESLNV